MNENKIIDILTYRSWLAQIELYKMSFKDARKLFKDAKLYEQKYLGLSK